MQKYKMWCNIIIENFENPKTTLVISRNLSRNLKKSVYIIKHIICKQIYIGCAQALNNKVFLRESNIKLQDIKELYIQTTSVSKLLQTLRNQLGTWLIIRRTIIKWNRKLVYIPSLVIVVTKFTWEKLLDLRKKHRKFPIWRWSQCVSKTKFRTKTKF